MRATSRQGGLRTVVAVLVAAVLASLGLVSLTLAAGSAQAAIPTPTDDEAVVQMYIGDLRVPDNGSIGPLPNAIFGLFATPPDAFINADDGYVHVTTLPAGTVLFQCKSDAQGDCVFTVPIRPGDTPTPCQATPTDPRSSWPVTCQAGAGVKQGARLWAAAITYNPGSDGFDYYANPWWQTAPLANTDHMSIRHVFQTPELVGGTTYRAGTDWITPAGAFTTPRTPSDPPQPGGTPSQATQRDLARRVASGGVTPLSRFNIDFPQQCGMNVGMVVDVSSSIGNSGAQGQLVDVMDSFVDALRGTPSSVALLTFGTDSPATGFGPNTGLQSVATTTDADAVKAQYASWRTRSWPTNYTNWDRGMAAAAAMNAPAGSPGHLDLVLFITDGNPTVYGANPLGSGSTPTDGNSGYTRFRELGNGLASANLVKSQGTRILAFGVGSGMGDPNTAYNLRTISGRDEYTQTPTGPYQTDNLLEADYVQTTDWTAAAAAMRSLVLEACAPSISVVKRIVPNGGTVDDAMLPTTQWGFEATTSTPDVTLTPATPPYALTDLGSGGVSFDVAFGDPAQAPASIRIEEDAGAQPDYTPMPEATTCVERSTGADITLPVTPDGTTAFTVPVDLEEMVTCVVYNRAPPDVVPAGVVVHKQWRVVTSTGVAVYPDGLQPAGLAAQLTLTGPDSTAATPQPWSTVRNGYDSASPVTSRNSTTIDETLNISPDLPLCVASGPPEIKTGDPDSTDPYTALPGGGLDSGLLPAGVSEWTIRNTIDCDSRLTLVKRVANGPLASADGEALWDLTGYGPAGTPGIPAEITGHSGDASITSVPVVPDSVYQLAEALPSPVPPGEDGHYLYHYRQADVRADPILYPQSSGSWDCRPDGNPTGDPSLGAEGAVVVPLGQAYTCVAVNSTALLTIDKTVDGTPASNPADWQFLVTANAPILIPDPQTHQFPAGVEQSLVPGQSYHLTEVAGLPNYTLASMTCTTGGEPIPDLADFALLVGATATCTANNVTVPPSSFTVTKTLTGTAAADPALHDVEFSVRWAANTSPAQSGTITLTAGQTAGPGGDFPAGTLITLTELTPTVPNPPASPSGSASDPPTISWASHRFTPGPGIVVSDDGHTATVTIPAAATASPPVPVTLVNEFDNQPPGPDEVDAGTLAQTGASGPLKPLLMLAVASLLLGMGLIGFAAISRRRGRGTGHERGQTAGG